MANLAADRKAKAAHSADTEEVKASNLSAKDREDAAAYLWARDRMNSSSSFRGGRMASRRTKL
jgi:hypothetical protein